MPGGYKVLERDEIVEILKKVYIQSGQIAEICPVLLSALFFIIDMLQPFYHYFGGMIRKKACIFSMKLIDVFFMKTIDSRFQMRYR